MTILVGRWDMLPEEWEGINGLYEKGDEEIMQEVGRQMDAFFDKHGHDDYRIGSYTRMEFQEEFNGDNEGDFNGTTYFIHIINN
jgi:hypothetical protein